MNNNSFTSIFDFANNGANVNSDNNGNNLPEEVTIDSRKYDLNDIDDVEDLIEKVKVMKEEYDKLVRENALTGLFHTLVSSLIDPSQVYAEMLGILDERLEKLYDEEEGDVDEEDDEDDGETCEDCPYYNREDDCCEMQDDDYVFGSDVTLEDVVAVADEEVDLDDRTFNSICEKIVEYMNAETTYYSSVMTEDEFEQIVNNILYFSAYIINGK